ncbi:MAG: hypothetical protein KH202_02175 [Clostridiales bacterium]|nr:hypothetical protein [Clostridiales bacterium]
MSGKRSQLFFKLFLIVVLSRKIWYIHDEEGFKAAFFSFLSGKTGGKLFFKGEDRPGCKKHY